MNLEPNQLNEVLFLGFNQDCTCFVCGTEGGFRVYSTNPFRLTHRRDFENGGGIGIVAMLFRTNIMAFVGGGRCPRFHPHKVCLWDDRRERITTEVEFRSNVRSVSLRKDLVVVALECKVYVYGPFRTMTQLDSIDTTANPKGLCCLSVGGDRVALVCPGLQKGRALVVFYPRDFGDPSGPVDRERTTIIAAHDSPLAAMALNYDGSLLATASDKGTIVRVYDTTTGARLQELRRGADRAEIHSLAFSPAGEWLSVSSDKGTVHVFAVGGQSGLGDGQQGRPAGDAAAPSNSRSNFRRLSRVLPAYFASEWSFAQFRVPDHHCIAAFGSDPHTIMVVCANGSFYKARFNPWRGGEMVREEFAQFDDESARAAGAGFMAQDSSCAADSAGAVGVGAATRDGAQGADEAAASVSTAARSSDHVPEAGQDEDDAESTMVTANSSLISPISNHLAVGEEQSLEDAEPP